MNYYTQFISHAAQNMAPLSEALKGKQKALVWNRTMSDASNDTKVVLVDVAQLAHPHPVAPTCITTDASDFGV